MFIEQQHRKKGIVFKAFNVLGCMQPPLAAGSPLAVAHGPSPVLTKCFGLSIRFSFHLSITYAGCFSAVRELILPQRNSGEISMVHRGSQLMAAMISGKCILPGLHL